jgi:phospholipase A1/A2
MRFNSAARFCLAIAGFLAVRCAAIAENLVVTLVGPSESVAPGSVVPVGLLAANSGNTKAEFEMSPSMEGQLRLGTRSWPVRLNASPGMNAVVPPGGFAKGAYTLTVPPDASGLLVLEVSQGLSSPLRTVISVAPASEGTAARELTSANALEFKGGGHFSALDPVYFIYGPRAPAAKFQFSLKYRLLSISGDTPETLTSTVQFGYTQRSLWNVSANPSAFYDTSYMPSLFYQFRALAPGPDVAKGGLTWLGFQSGYQHESNGQGGLEERSLNSLFVRSSYLLGRPDRWHAIVQVRVFDYVGGLSNNPTLPDYRGYGDWQVILARGDGPSLNYTGWAGKDFNHLTSQFDLNFPIRTRLLDVATYFLVQYFDGYGESLREFDKPSNTVRAGFSLVR